jgi:predicted transcriptional regulator
MQHRGRTEILVHILNAANGGAIKTKIMYRAYLSHAQLKGYLVVLTENGLIEYDPKTTLYRTTDNGHKFIKLYNHLGEFVAEQEPRGLPYT